MPAAFFLLFYFYHSSTQVIIRILLSHNNIFQNEVIIHTSPHLITSTFFCRRYNNFQCDGTLHAFPHHITSQLIYLVDIFVGMIPVSRTSTAASEFCKTGFTLVFGIDIARFKCLTDILSVDTFPHIAHEKFLVTDKLMAWIQISPRGNCEILGSGTAA
jgi:hypothetical protein